MKVRHATGYLLALIVLGTASVSRGSESHALHAYAIAGARSGNTFYGRSIQSHTAPADSFYLYGGPGATEGKFESADGSPDMQGWVGVDLTEEPPFWHLSTFNSPTGTQAAWCGRTADDEPGWVTAPGYGNNWDQELRLTLRVNEPMDPTDLTWTFTYNYDLEPIYDFFTASWDSMCSGNIVRVPLLTHDGTNKDSLGLFHPVAEQLARHFEPSEYLGDGSDEIWLRIRVTSDGGWSDEDGLWPTVGAVQIDDVVVDLGPQGGPFVANFENGLDPWEALPTNFVGDFAKAFGAIQQLDHCRTNRSPQLSFIDDGTPPSNGGGRTTGGIRVGNCGYGCPLAGHILNYEGGLSGGLKGLDNRAWSPPIEYDLPGTADDGADGALILSFDLNAYLPLNDGMFYVWHIRSTEDPTGSTGWTDWLDNDMVYYYSDGYFGAESLERIHINVAGKVPDLSRVEKVQIALGVRDLASVFGLSGLFSTQAPTFDNVSLQKAAAAGPLLQARALHLLQGGFPESGIAPSQYDGPGPTDETIFATRIDRFGAINMGGETPVAGDSLTVTVHTVIPGTVLSERPVLKYRLFANPAFDHVRDTSMHDNYAGTIATGPGGAWDVWDGTAIGDSVQTHSGEHLPDTFAFDPPFDGPVPRGGGIAGDLPEAAGFFPGDWFFYYVEAADDAGNIVTIPAGPGQGSPPQNWPQLVSEGGTILEYSGLARTSYDASWRIRALPTIGSETRTLFINDGYGRGTEAVWHTALLENGLLEGIHVDTYPVFAPDFPFAYQELGSGVVHGATAEQLEGYEILLYDGGSASLPLLSNGTIGTLAVDSGGGQSILAAWHEQPGDRAAAYWGDNLVSTLHWRNPSFVRHVLGVQRGPYESYFHFTGHYPDILSLQSGLSFGLQSGCPQRNRIDHIQPWTGSFAVTTHLFQSGNGVVTEASASVTYDRMVDGFRKIDMTFPFAFDIIGPPLDSGASDGRTPRSVFLEDVLNQLGGTTHGPTAVPDGPIPLQLEANWPNPFNPRTTIRFSLPQSQQARLRVVDTRGRVVRTLVDDVLPAGHHDIAFDGRDDRGSELASGVYLYELIVDRTRHVRKLALLR